MCYGYAMININYFFQTNDAFFGVFFKKISKYLSSSVRQTYLMGEALHEPRWSQTSYGWRWLVCPGWTEWLVPTRRTRWKAVAPVVHCREEAWAQTRWCTCCAWARRGWRPCDARTAWRRCTWRRRRGLVGLRWNRWWSSSTSSGSLSGCEIWRERERERKRGHRRRVIFMIST